MCISVPKTSSRLLQTWNCASAVSGVASTSAVVALMRNTLALMRIIGRPPHRYRADLKRVAGFRDFYGCRRASQLASEVVGLLGNAETGSATEAHRCARARRR